MTMARGYEARDRPHARARRREGLPLPRQEAGLLVHHRPDRARRGGGRVRGPHLAVDLRRVRPRDAAPGRRSSPGGRRGSSSGRPPPGRCRRTSRSPRTPSSVRRLRAAAAQVVVVAKDLLAALPRRGARPDELAVTDAPAPHSPRRARGGDGGGGVAPARTSPTRERVLAYFDGQGARGAPLPPPVHGPRVRRSSSAST